MAPFGWKKRQWLDIVLRFSRQPCRHNHPLLAPVDCNGFLAWILWFGNRLTTTTTFVSLYKTLRFTLLGLLTAQWKNYLARTQTQTCGVALAKIGDVDLFVENQLKPSSPSFHHCNTTLVSSGRRRNRKEIGKCTQLTPNHLYLRRKTERKNKIYCQLILLRMLYEEIHPLFRRENCLISNRLLLTVRLWTILIYLLIYYVTNVTDIRRWKISSRHRPTGGIRWNFYSRSGKKGKMLIIYIKLVNIKITVVIIQKF